MSNKKKIVSVLLVGGLIIGYTSQYVYGLQQELIGSKKQAIRYEKTIQELKVLSPVELDNINLQEAQKNAKRYNNKEIEYKKRKETAILTTRCLKKKLIGEETNCKDNLQKYSNIKKKK